MNNSLFDLLKSETSTVDSDALEKIRELLRQARDLDVTISEKAESLETAQKALANLKSRVLPDAFAQLGIDNLGLPAEGNLPAYDAKLKPFYKASIPKNKTEEACDYLESIGCGDLIKRIITIRLGRGEEKLAAEIASLLSSLGVGYSEERSVPWTTLTAWLKERVNKYIKQAANPGKLEPDELIEYPELEVLGAVVGQVVDIKKREADI